MPVGTVRAPFSRSSERSLQQLARQGYLGGEFCGVGPDGITSFSMIQLAADSDNAAALVFFLFDLLYLDGENLIAQALIDRKTRLAALLSNVPSPLQYCDHQIGRGPEFHKQACAMSLEGIVSKRADAAYAPRRPRIVAQGQMPPPRRIRGAWLDRS